MLSLLFRIIFIKFPNFFLYFFLWKNFAKRIIRFLTGTHEIERVVKNGKYNHIKNCINYSYELEFLQTKLNNEELLDESDIKTITITKNIKDETFYMNISRFFNRLNKIKHLKNDIRNWYNEKVILNDHKHSSFLMKLWKSIKGDISINIKDKNWMKIGFQGEDPSTDFRGTGFLGLRNLVYFVESKTNDAIEVISTALSDKRWYFFAAAGINITGKLIYLIEKNKIDEFLYNCIDRENLFDEIYCLFFINFNKFWVENNCTDFMKFNNMLEIFFERYSFDTLQKFNKSEIKTKRNFS